MTEILDVDEQVKPFLHFCIIDGGIPYPLQRDLVVSTCPETLRSHINNLRSYHNLLTERKLILMQSSSDYMIKDFKK